MAGKCNTDEVFALRENRKKFCASVGDFDRLPRSKMWGWVLNVSNDVSDVWRCKHCYQDCMEILSA